MTVTIAAVVNAPSISQRAAAVRPSATLQMSARAASLRDRGIVVSDFSAGEPDFLPPQAVRDAVINFARDRAVRYTAVPGMPMLREAVAEHLGAYHGRSIGAGEVLVSCGAKHSIMNYMFATLDPGDEVVIPVPSWVSYPDMARLAGAMPVPVATSAESGFRLQPEALEAALTDKTKLLILNSPGNPTGMGYDRTSLRDLIEVLVRRAPQAWILADDIYRQLVYPPFRHESFVRAVGDLTDQVVLVDGVSKTYAMTGYRIGFLAAPTAVVTAAARIQGQVTSGAATLSQHAALAALTDPSVPQQVTFMQQAFARRRQMMLDELTPIEGLTALPPEGAFYLWLNVARYLQRGTAPQAEGGEAGPPTKTASNWARFADDAALADWLLQSHHVATVAGSAFGGPGYLRLSYATDDVSILEGCQRLGVAFAQLRAGDLANP